MSKPIAVLISDIHFNLNTLERAAFSLEFAIKKAQHYNVPLIVAGDTLDTKCVLRAEYVNRLIDIFKEAKGVDTYHLVGNHDLFNEKSNENALKFLEPYVSIVASHKKLYLKNLNNPVYLIPYQSYPQIFIDLLTCIPKSSPIVMHQGVKGATAGEYFNDKTAIDVQILAGRRIISGHYHNRQSFKLDEGGSFDFIGNPYTLGFGEAGDPDKGIQLLMEDLSLEFIPVNLPAHRVVQIDWSTKVLQYPRPFKPADILKVLVKGFPEQLLKVTKEDLAAILHVDEFTMEPVPITVDTEAPSSIYFPPDKLLIQLINNANISQNQKTRLQELCYKL